MTATTDLCDAHEALIDQSVLRVLPPVFKAWGKNTAFSGPAFTLKVFEDNTLVRSTLETPGNGQVLVVDGGGSQRCALLGGNLAVLAEKNGWAGVVIDGCVRDGDEIDACAIGVRALNSHPQKSRKSGAGQSGLQVTIAGVKVSPGHWVYADRDGVLIADKALA